MYYYSHAWNTKYNISLGPQFASVNRIDWIKNYTQMSAQNYFLLYLSYLILMTFKSFLTPIINHSMHTISIRCALYFWQISYYCLWVMDYGATLKLVYIVWKLLIVDNTIKVCVLRFCTWSSDMFLLGTNVIVKLL